MHPIQKEFDNQCLYPLEYNDVIKGVESVRYKDLIPNLGRRALIEKTIPFTGTINEKIFRTLPNVLEPNYFESYRLNTDPQTMNTEKKTKFHTEKHAKLRQNLINEMEIDAKVDKISRLIQDLSSKIKEKKRHHIVDIVDDFIQALEGVKLSYKSRLYNAKETSHEAYRAELDPAAQAFIKRCDTLITEIKLKLKNDLDLVSYLQNVLIKLCNIVIGGVNKVTGKNISFYKENVPDSIKTIEAAESQLKQGPTS